MRPSGWNAQLMNNVAFGYRHERGWDRGPHFFPDDSGKVWGLTPPSERGIHAVSFNRTHIGIEVLGDYDGRDDATTGRGRACWQTAFWTIAEILRWLGLQPDFSTINFHRDDPKTSKTCPGTSIIKSWVIAGVCAAMGIELDGPPPPSAPSASDVRVAISAWLRVVGKALPIILDPRGHVLVGGKWIESARYDRLTQTTTALRSELEADLGGLS